MNKDKTRIWIMTGGLFCAVYVALGAFGAHGLKSVLSSSEMATFNTGLRYMIIHALGIVLINLVYFTLNVYNKVTNPLMIGGIILFSLSLILHSLKTQLGFEFNFFAMLAPVGGLSFIAGWLSFVFTLRRN